MAVGLKYKFGYDDSLDVVGVHLVAGLVGTVGIGFLATSGGLLYGDGLSLAVVQVVIALFAGCAAAGDEPPQAVPLLRAAAAEPTAGDHGRDTKGVLHTGPQHVPPQHATQR